jgi:hypothetical protein
MERKIKVRFSTGESKEVSVEEAKRILDETYNDPLGGLVANGKTKEVISQIGPDVEEIIVLETMIGGG